MALCLYAVQAQSSPVYTDLHDFGGTITDSYGALSQDGFNPYGPVAFDNAGNMWGSANNGGPNAPSCGLLWEITVSGQYIDRHDFGGTITSSLGGQCQDGFNLWGALTFDGAGNLYGVGPNGGAYGWTGGMIWELTASGSYIDLHDFGGTIIDSDGKSGPDGIKPTGGIVFDKSGNMYGATLTGGRYGGGILWEITASGKFQDLHDFGGTVTDANGSLGPDGSKVFGQVTLDTHGDLIGSATNGGASQDGMLWELTSAGVYLDLHDFSGGDGASPLSPVSLDSAGNMYGTAQAGGAHLGGVIWEITASGAYLILHNFGGTVATGSGTTGSDGTAPFSGVNFDSEGNFFGTTFYGGGVPSTGPSFGIVWELTRSGAYIDLHDFGGTITNANGSMGPDGGLPVANIVFDAVGNAYGTTANDNVTSGGGPGMIYKLVVPSSSYSLSVSPTTVTGGASATGAITLNRPAPNGGAKVTLSSNSASATVPVAVTVPAGSSSATFAVTTSAVSANTNVVITATAGGVSVNAALAINPTTLSGLSLSPTSLTGGASSTGTVTLSGPAPTGGLSVALSSGGISATAPASVTVAAGSTTATFTVTTTAVTKSTAVEITATAGTSTQSVTLTINPPALQSVTLSPANLYGGASSTCTVTLTGPAPAGGYSVSLASNNLSASVQATLLVQAKGTMATAKVTTSAVATQTVATITGTYGGVSQQASLTINPPALTGLSLSPTSVIGGSSSTGTVTLNSAAPTGGLTISLSSNSTSAVTPASVTVAAGATSGTFTITTSAVSTNTTAVIMASFGTASFKPSLLITPATLSSVSVSPSSVVGGSNAPVTGTVTLGSAAGPSGLVVTLSSSSSSAKVPSTVKVAAGATTATFTVTTSQVAAVTSATIAATLSGASVTTTLTVNPYQVASLSASPTSVVGGMTTTCTVTLNAPAPTGAMTVSLSSNSSSLGVPTTVVIPAGASTASFSATSSPVATSTSATLQSWVGSSSAAGQSASVTVNPPSIVNVLFVPPSVSAGTSTTLYVILNGLAPAGASLQVSTNSTRLTVGTSLAMVAGQAAQTFTLPTTAGAPTTVTITVTYNGGSQSSTLTITP